MKKDVARNVMKNMYSNFIADSTCVPRKKWIIK